jgi:myo-inositol-1(or 4)-monophosphatase
MFLLPHSTLIDSFLFDIRSFLKLAVYEAGELAMSFFKEGEPTTAHIWEKVGGSPVTEADVSVDAFLKIRLATAFPDAGWLSEETFDSHERLARPFVFVVDPIDGTRGFISGHKDWGIALAVLHHNEPVYGAFYAPAHNKFYEALRGRGALCNDTPIRVRMGATLEGARVSGPPPMVDRLVQGNSRAESIIRVDKIPSLAMRIARVADGSLDLALVSRDAKDWDLAAVDVILREAGGTLTNINGEALVYNARDPSHPSLVAAAPSLHEQARHAMRLSKSVMMDAKA